MENSAEHGMRLLLDNMPLGCLLRDKDFNVIDCNRAFLELFGFGSAEEYSAGWRDILVEEQKDGSNPLKLLEKSVKEAVENGRSTLEWMLKRTDGTIVPIESTFVRAVWQGKECLAIFARDLRKEKEMLESIRLASEAKAQLEIAEENSRAKTMFLARMSHEIRTPITAIMGIAEIQLQNPEISPVMEESFAKIHNSSTILLGIINDILDLSKIETGKMELLHEKYGLASLISDVTHLQLVNFATKSIKFNVIADKNLPAYLCGDALRIGQIINNLLSNSFKYTSAGEVEMSVSCVPEAAGSRFATLIISVKDTGAGMNEEQLSGLFREYARFHEDKSRHIDGTGLGMSIVRKLADLMNARILINSKEGEGTEISVHIPQEISGTEVIGEKGAKKLRKFEVTADTAAKKFKFVPESMPYGKVLIVDDVEANLYVAKGLLGFYDLDVETCGNGYEAIEKIKRGKVYNIVFMDHMMPGIDGVEAMKAMRGLGYTHPIVALTANALIGQAEEFIKKGFDGFISKPIQTKHLNAILTRHIKDKQPPEVIEAARASSEEKNKDIEEFRNSAELKDKLRKEFYRTQKNAYTEIAKTLQGGDTATAHRLSHTLKSVAALIEEDALTEAARELEYALAGGQGQTDGLLQALKTELEQVLSGIPAPVPEAASQIYADREKALSVLKKVQPLLKTSSTECQDYLDELSAIPEAAVLCKLIRDYDFTLAAKVADKLAEIFEE